MTTRQATVARLQSRIDQLQRQARQRTARAIAKRKAQERMPDPATIGVFDSSQADDAELNAIAARWGLSPLQSHTGGG